MSVNILVKRSPTANKRPVGTSMVFGELNLNYDASTGGLYYKNSAGTVVKVGPCQVSATAPNSSPAGSAGNSAGEFWFDSSTDTLKVYNGADWVETGGSVQGVSGTAPITVNNTNPLTPVIGVDAGTTSAAGVLQLTDSTSSTSTTTAATPNSVKTAYDLANAALPKAGGTMSGDITLDAALVDGLGSPGTSGYILSSTNTGVEWVANTADGVLGVTGNAPITVDNTDPANPVISVNTGSTSQLGALQVGTNVDVAAGVISVKTGTSVDLGVVQVGTNIDVAAGVISVADSTTSGKGVVQLYNATDSTSDTLALTAAQGKNLQDQIDALVVGSNITLAGTYNATTGFVDNVTAAGTAAGFANGSALPSPGPTNTDFFVIVDVQGTNGPNSPTLCHIGDWFLSDGTTWQFLNVGFQASAATTTNEGVVYLATNAEVQSGTDTSNKAVNPASLQSKISNSVSTTSSATIASSTAVKSAYDLANSALQRSGGTMTGVITFAVAQTFPITGIQDATTSQKGVVQIGTNINVTSGTISVASASLSTVGVVQLSNATASTSNTTAATSSAVLTVYDLAINRLPLTGGTLSGPLTLGSSLGDAGGFAGVAGYLLTSTGSATSWQPNTSISYNIFDAKGDLIVATGDNNNYSRLAVGTNDYVLTADSTQATGVKWAAVAGPDGVQGITGTAPITIDNTDPANPIVEIDAATTSSLGVVQLATDAEVQAGLDTDHAVVSSSLQSKISDSVSTTSSTTIASSTAVKTAYDLADAAIPDSTFTAAGELIVGTGAGTYAPLSDGSANQILATDGAGTLSWVNNTVDGVQGITGTAPITIDNTDPANPIVEIDAATTSISGAVQLYDDVDSTSTSLAATANAVKIAYDAALLSGITSATTIYVNNTNGNDSTGERGTTKAFLTITAALAVALNDDTIFLSPGTFTENVTLTKGVTLIGTWQDQSLSDGTTIVGNFVFDMVTPVATSAPSINHIRFVSTNATSAFTILNNAQTDGTTVISDCCFTLAGSTTEFCFETVGTWPRSLYMRRPTFDGNIKHAAGTAAGASGYLVLDGILATGSASRHYAISTGTVEFRRPSNALSPVLQTGGVVLFTDCIAGLTPSNATTSPVFGGTDISYKGAAASLGTGTVYFNGYTPIAGVVNIGANMIYGWSGLNVTPANLLINGSAVAYTTAVPAAAAVVTASQQRPRFDLLTAISSVSAANQLATVIDSTSGTLYTVAALDAGEF